MDEEEQAARLASDLVGSSGGYLRNTLRSSVLACTVCAGPVTGWTKCYKCGQIYEPSRWAADQVATMVYAVSGQQSGFMMRGYKAARPVREHVVKVGSLAWIGIRHRRCAGAILGVPVTQWATVPSIPARATQHPLNRLVARNVHLRLPELPLVASATATSPRDVRPDNVTVPPVDELAHVLLLDDTWVGGGHAQSAAAAIKMAGARHVSILAIARWLEPSDHLTADFIRDHFDSCGFDPSRCPWTGTSCPTSDAGGRHVVSG